MSVNEFTKDEIEYLLSLRAVNKVSNGRIRYSEEFKRECMQKYADGESPIKIFRDAGMDPVLIGYKRIERCISRWRENNRLASNSSGGGIFYGRWWRKRTWGITGPRILPQGICAR